LRSKNRKKGKGGGKTSGVKMKVEQKNTLKRKNFSAKKRRRISFHGEGYCVEGKSWKEGGRPQITLVWKELWRKIESKESNIKEGPQVGNRIYGLLKGWGTTQVIQLQKETVRRKCPDEPRTYIEIKGIQSRPILEYSAGRGKSGCRDLGGDVNRSKGEFHLTRGEGRKESDSKLRERKEGVEGKGKLQLSRKRGKGASL